MATSTGHGLSVAGRLPKNQQARLTSTSSSSENTSDDGMTRPVFKNGRYANPWPTFKFPTYGDMFKAAFTMKFAQIPSKQELDQTLPVKRPDLKMLATPPKSGVRVTWIGHATVLVQMEGLSFLTDPVFSTTASPFHLLGPKRYRPVPLTIHELPKINAVLISHNHYDHLDKSSVQMLNARFGDEIRWFVPVGLASWMHGVGCDNVVEMDWWDENSLTHRSDVKFAFVPAQHWSKRTLLDANTSLWGGWCVLGPWQRFYFAGDTGYCTVFEQIGNKYGPFDVAALPIGAFEPRALMKSQHVNPSDAVQIHIDIKAKKSIAIHWGTFNLSSEGYLDPPRLLQEALEEKHVPLEDFLVLSHGETKHIGDSFHTLD